MSAPHDSMCQSGFILALTLRYFGLHTCNSPTISWSRTTTNWSSRFDCLNESSTNSFRAICSGFSWPKKFISASSNRNALRPENSKIDRGHKIEFYWYLPIFINWLAKCVSACRCFVTDSSSVCVIGFETVSTAASLEFIAPSMIEIDDN